MICILSELPSFCYFITATLIMDNKWGYTELKRERSTMGSLIDEAVFE